MNNTRVGTVTIGPSAPLAIIAGPCVAESRDLCLRVGEAMRDRCSRLGLSYIFKASFDKANRSSIKSYRGPGLDDGLALIDTVRRKLGVPATTDIHEAHQAAPAAQAVDLLQIPAFLCRQTDLLLAAALTGAAVNVKKGQFLSPQEMVNVVKKLEEGFAEAGKKRMANSDQRMAKSKANSDQRIANRRRRSVIGDQRSAISDQRFSPGLVLTERGTFFGYHRLVNDFVGLGDMMELGWPVCFDVTHSTQQPGGQGASSGGRPERAPLLARAAVAAGVQALFMEVHPDPKSAQSDAATMLTIDRAARLLDELARLHQAIGEHRSGRS